MLTTAIPCPVSGDTAVNVATATSKSSITFVKIKMATIEEERAMGLAIKGHSVFISGQCGTGKTYLLR